MSGYPHDQAGHKGRDTGRAAAALQQPRLKEMREIILAEFDNGPGNPEAIWQRLKRRGFDFWPMTVRCRVSDLNKLGLVIDTGERGVALSGKAKSIIWRKATSDEVSLFKARQAAQQEKEGADE